MTTHFSAIGFSTQNQDEFRKLIIKAAEEGINTETDAGIYIQWKEKNGAELWVQVDKNNALIGLNPHYAGKAIMRVGVIKQISRARNSALDGAYYGWADPTGDVPDHGTYPFVFDLPNFLTNPLQLPTIIDVQISAFAHELQIYSDEDKFAEAGTHFAPESFIPSGLFTPKMEAFEEPASQAIFTGKVIQHSTLTNEFTGLKYEWALVKTLGGEIDVVADPSLMSEEIHPGGIISGSFWLSGKIICPE